MSVCRRNFFTEDQVTVEINNPNIVGVLVRDTCEKALSTANQRKWAQMSRCVAFCTPANVSNCAVVFFLQKVCAVPVCREMAQLSTNVACCLRATHP